MGTSGRENLSREDMQYFMDTYFPGMLTHKEIKSLIGPNGMKFEKLRKLLVDNDLVDFDPCAEAFKVRLARLSCYAPEFQSFTRATYRIYSMQLIAQYGTA